MKKILKNIFSIIFQIMLLLLSVTLPLFAFNFDTSNMLTVVSLLFAILIGFFIAAATSNYLRLQTLISDEDASLMSIFDLIKIIQPSVEKKCSDLIDKYMIAALDYDQLDYFMATSTEFNNLSSMINKVSPSDGKGVTLLQNLQDVKGNIVSIRQEALVLVKRAVTSRHWFILISLAVIISIVLLGLRDGSMLVSSLVGLTLIALYQTLNLLYKIDSNTFLADKLAYEVPQKVFLTIGQTKYYPESVMNEELRKSLEKENYRVGFYKDFSKSMEKRIKMIKKAKQANVS
ncbi:MAG: DUF4239 domain-containing protein [Candidatus Moranbacteria bacterium]|jgi:hypothetical protein|nr:DUF4239 domain-containing protein [Candidatus Moranbacteria bacterium]